MKTFVKILFVLVLLVGLVYGYIAWGPGVSATLESVSYQSATEREETFQTILEGVKRGDFGQNQYRQPPSDNPGDYSFVTVTVSARNLYPLMAEWALINLSPGSGDIVLIQSEPADISPFGSLKVSATILATNDARDEQRLLWLEYYLLGNKKSEPAV